MRRQLPFFLAGLLALLVPETVRAQPFPVTQTNDGISLKFTSGATSAGCAFGEINAFSQESSQGPKSFRLLLSLEPLEPADVPARRTDISRFDLKKPFTTSFRYPRLKKKSYVALYICSDWERVDHCSGKPHMPLEQYFSGRDPQQKKVKIEGEQRADEIFYFALLVLENDRAELVGGRAIPSAMLGDLRAGGASPEQLAQLSRELEAYGSPLVTPSVDGLALKFRFREISLCR